MHNAPDDSVCIAAGYKDPKWSEPFWECLSRHNDSDSLSQLAVESATQSGDRSPLILDTPPLTLTPCRPHFGRWPTDRQYEKGHLCVGRTFANLWYWYEERWYEHLCLSRSVHPVSARKASLEAERDANTCSLPCGFHLITQKMLCHFCTVRQGSLFPSCLIARPLRAFIRPRDLCFGQSSMLPVSITSCSGLGSQEFEEV